jgi:hypothetical protein
VRALRDPEGSVCERGARVCSPGDTKSCFSLVKAFVWHGCPLSWLSSYVLLRPPLFWDVRRGFTRAAPQTHARAIPFQRLSGGGCLHVCSHGRQGQGHQGGPQDGTWCREQQRLPHCASRHRGNAKPPAAHSPCLQLSVSLMVSPTVVPGRRSAPSVCDTTRLTGPAASQPVLTVDTC